MLDIGLDLIALLLLLALADILQLSVTLCLLLHQAAVAVLRGLRVQLI
jgi:hypothetical protein